MNERNEMRPDPKGNPNYLTEHDYATIAILFGFTSAIAFKDFADNQEVKNIYRQLGISMEEDIA